MDLGISGRRALVCASSSGLGRACAEALAAEGVNVTINGRDPDRLAQTAAELRDAFPAVEAEAVVGDITTPEGREALLQACPQPDILITNNAGPTPSPFLDTSEGAWTEALEGNMVISAGPRAGLTAVCKGISRDVARHNVTVNNLLPERFNTGRQREMAERDMQRHGISMEEARHRMAQTIAAQRMGSRRSSERRARSCARPTPAT